MGEREKEGGGEWGQERENGGVPVGPTCLTDQVVTGLFRTTGHVKQCTQGKLELKHNVSLN